MPVKRLNYFHYQFLQEQDFKDEQSYHVAMRRRHNSEFHTFGRVRGLDVTFVAGERRVRISPGTAVDSLGREIVVESNLDVDLQSHAGATVYLTIAHKEEGTDASTQPGVAGNFTRTTESFQNPRISATAPTDPTLDLILGRITLNANPPDGAVTAVDFSERTEAGAKIGQTDLPALRFIVPAHGGSEWPRIAGNNVSGPGTGMQGITVDAGITAFSGSVSVAQSMTVQGDLSVQGVINRVNDLEVRDSIIRVNQYEPPSATPAIVNGGLEVYRGGTAPNAQIIWDETADAWRIGVATGLDTVVTNARLTSHNHDAGNGGVISHTSLSNIAPAVVSSTDAIANKHVSNLQAKGWQDHVNIVGGQSARDDGGAGRRAGGERVTGSPGAWRPPSSFRRGTGTAPSRRCSRTFKRNSSGSTGRSTRRWAVASSERRSAAMPTCGTIIQRGNGASSSVPLFCHIVFIVPLTYGALWRRHVLRSDGPAKPLPRERDRSKSARSPATNVTVQLSRGVPFSSTIAYLPIAGLSDRAPDSLPGLRKELPYVGRLSQTDQGNRRPDAEYRPRCREGSGRERDR